MCNTKLLSYAAMAGATYFTGGAALGALGTAGATVGSAGILGPLLAGSAVAPVASAGISASTIASGLSIASGVVGGASQYLQGQAAGDAADANAKIAKRQGQDALIRGGIEEERYRDQLAKFQGQQRAIAGGAGRAGTGSLLDILAETAGVGEMDALTIRNNAMREAYGYQVESLNLKRQGKMARSGGIGGGFGTLLTSGAQAGGIYLNR